MDLTRQSPAPTRYMGIGLVIALHLAGIYALSAGLIKPLTQPPTITTLKPLPPDVKEPPPPTEPFPVDGPKLHQPQPIPVPPIPFDVTPTQTPLISTVPLDGTPVTMVPTATGKADPTPHQPSVVVPQISTAGAVCSVMPRPEVPAVNWSGEAVLQVLATVKGGRVVGQDVRVLQGAMDGKTRRSLQRSVESALAGYQCQGDATFQQDFAFRLD
ncbi:hypothetical protein [Roseateles asaccharophilus]|uniref:Uncharacterized protein n=1 Tax=Roseateles asaccharophilus TaxID=582607 RepID=A0ABU2AAU9_9BURK|nr:hypothetical protein [Roseateles asaccharophilus]MDR7334291.1 hypothetical protein [Roseateles asaccharophilus]